MKMRAVANVFAIAPGRPFLSTLVAAIREGSLGFEPLDSADPLALASTTIYVPTRRAARSLRAVFAETGKFSSAILPVIRPLGDFDEDMGFFSEDSVQALTLPPPIGADDRVLALASLTQAWSRQMAAQKHYVIKDEAVMLPRTSADAIWLARDLASVIDELENEGVGLDKLKDIDPETLPGWWQITREFLEIVATYYPSFLAEKNLSSIIARRNALIDAEAERLRLAQPSGAVVAAGSTGSIQSTAKLLAVVSRLPMGAVVLPGLDRSLDEESWEKIGHPDKSPSSFGHPQFGLGKLLRRFSLKRDDIRFLGEEGADVPLREKLVSEVLRPAETTEKWGLNGRDHSITGTPEAISGISLIEAPTEREEALAVAIALRNALDERRTNTAALVTNDRNLARRVRAELLRFGIRADDSGGTPLANSPQAVLFQLTLRVAFEADPSVDLLALLKHPLARFGEDKDRMVRAAQALELIAFRGVHERFRPEGLLLHFEKQIGRGANQHRKPFWLGRLSSAEIDDARLLAALAGGLVAPLCALREHRDALTVSHALKTSLGVFENIGRDDRLSLAPLYEGEEGEQFAAHLRGLLAADSTFSFQPVDWPAVHDALLSGKMVKPKAGSDPNVFIWGALEARLQEVDTLVLGGLNENAWPARPAEDPFLSRSMKASLMLEPPERRIGQAAHDFMMGMGAKTVILARSTRKDGAPTIASRWLQRFLALIGEESSKLLRARGLQYLDWARALDARPDLRLESRPKPSPPVELRPKHFSVTEIKTLRHDPYAIHARHILNLRPLDPLVRDPDARERGTLFHDIMARFIGTNPDFDNEQAAAKQLREIARQMFAAQEVPTEISAVWLPRFETLTARVIELERKRRAGVRETLVEKPMRRMLVGSTGVTLSAVADRIDMRLDGSADIIDYKTNKLPSKSDARNLKDPQLALEAALLSQGAVAETGAAKVADMLYYRLLTKGEADIESILDARSQITVDDLLTEAWQMLIKTLEFYQRPETAYISHLVPMAKKESDYDHLARVAEWSSGGDDDAGDEE